MTDTHAHFRSPDDYPDLGSLRVLAVGCDPQSNAAARLAAERPGIRFALGLDYSQMETSEETFEGFASELARLPDLAAIGEIGLDFHYAAPETAPLQSRLFLKQLHLARELGKPAVFHVRQAESLFLELYSQCPVPGVVHSFTGDADFARACLEKGLYLGFGGILTFRNAEPLRAVAATVPLPRLLLETDSPYLAPVPLRGRPCRPDYVAHTAARLAQIKGIPLPQLEVITDANADDLFGPWPTLRSCGSCPNPL